MKGLQQQLLSKYKYNKQKPIKSDTNYSVYSGTSVDGNVPVTIKILKYPSSQLGPYLSRLKQIKSQGVIKIHQLLIQQQILIMVTQQSTFGTLKSALRKCTYLDQNDALFLGRTLLAAHVDLLRMDFNWFGNQEDIQIMVDGAFKLSWNNGCSFNLVNPFPIIFAKFSNRPDNNNIILPLPKSKALEELIKISKDNASEISLNAQMKKKEKLVKRKGKGWIGLKQYKSKNQYFDQLIYFAVHVDHGFIRVKISQSGKISPNQLQIHKTSPYFSLILQVQQQVSKTVLISSYSNQGSLQSYLAKLKSNSTKIKQQQIQYIIYSLFQPLKQIQQSSVKCLCMLGLRGIYIHNGLIHIAQPLILTDKIIQVMDDRKDVPDFYHFQFKTDPLTRDIKYDTYAMGVLMYRLMYGDFPIFIQNRVKLPSAPTYRKQIKQAVQIFLNQGGMVRQIQTKIQILQSVRKLIDQNILRLKSSTTVSQQKLQKIQKGQHSQDQQQKQEQSSDSSDNGDHPPQQQSDDQQQPGYISRFIKCIQLKQPKKVQEQKRLAFIDQLQLSSFKKFRIWSKCVLLFILYVFIFYFNYLSNIVSLLSSQSLLTPINLTISSSNLTIITTDKYIFEKTFNSTNKSLVALQGMNCLIEDFTSKGKYTSVIYDGSWLWIGFILAALAVFCTIFILFIAIILLLKAIMIHTFDQVHALFRKQQGDGHFNLSNWLLVNLFWTHLITGHYFVFNYIFESQTQPCVGHSKGHIYGSSQALFSSKGNLILPYMVVFFIQFLLLISYLIMIGKNQKLSLKYNAIINPIVIFSIILGILWLIIRFGIILGDYYYPTAINDYNKVILSMWRDKDWVAFFGVIPEVLLLIEILISLLMNWIYYTFVDKTQQRLLSNDQHLDASLSGLV